MEDIAALKKGDIKAFEEAFKTDFKGLHAYAYTILKDETAAEEAVQNVFYKLWERKDQLVIETSLKAYLYKSVYHESLNNLKHQKVKSKYQSFAMQSSGFVSNNDSRLHLKELQHKLRHALNDLPEQCRTVFQLSRFNELRYREIADLLGISIKTVENQMGKALKVLRLKLAEFMPVIMIFINLLS